jgi:hypothetical protein
VRPVSNISIHSYTTLRERTFSPYWTHMRRWIFAPGTPSVNKKLMTDRCPSLVRSVRFTLFTGH